MDRKQFEMRYNFVPVFDTRVKKRRSLAPHLANDPKYMEKHGFIKIEAPEMPKSVDFDKPHEILEAFGDPLPIWANGVEITTQDKTEEQITSEINKAVKKRGRPKKQK